jgi:hypothetical protein
MASTFTGLGVELQATGENAGTWGTKTNTNLQLLEQIIGGFTQQSIAGGAQTTALTVNDGSTGATLAHRMIEFTGSISGNQIVTIPNDVQTFYFLRNSTSGSFTVQFKYATGSGDSFTFTATDKGDQLVFASANDGSNPDIITLAFGDGDVTLTGTQTLTNKTLTSPAIGTAILDTNGAESIKFTATSSATNEFTVTNAANGSAPTLSATGSSDSNVNINFAPKGSGEIVIGTGSANATLTTSGAHDLILDTNSGTNSGSITITDGADGNINIAPNGNGVVQAGGSAVKVAGKETMYVPAQAMYAATTNGAAAGQAELTAGNPELKTFDFDASTAESVQFNVCFPKSWNEGTITYQTFWSASGTNTGTGGYKLSGVSIGDNVDYDTAFGTAVANTAKAASGTQDDLMVNDESGAVTVASAAVDTNTVFKLERNVATDTNTGDLRLVGIKLFFTTDAANDA